MAQHIMQMLITCLLTHVADPPPVHLFNTSVLQTNLGVWVPSYNNTFSNTSPDDFLRFLIAHWRDTYSHSNLAPDLIMSSALTYKMELIYEEAISFITRSTADRSRSTSGAGGQADPGAGSTSGGGRRAMLAGSESVSNRGSSSVGTTAGGLGATAGDVIPTSDANKATGRLERTLYTPGMKLDRVQMGSPPRTLETTPEGMGISDLIRSTRSDPGSAWLEPRGLAGRRLSQAGGPAAGAGPPSVEQENVAVMQSVMRE